MKKLCLIILPLDISDHIHCLMTLLFTFDSEMLFCSNLRIQNIKIMFKAKKKSYKKTNDMEVFTMTEKYYLDISDIS